MRMPRLKHAMFVARGRNDRALQAMGLEIIAQDLEPLPTDGAATPRQLLAALDRLSSAVIAATGSSVFLSSERIQLIDLAHKLAWLLVRVHRSEAMLAEVADLAGTTRATLRAHHQLQSVETLGGGVAAIAGLFDLIAHVDALLPAPVERTQ